MRMKYSCLKTTTDSYAPFSCHERLEERCVIAGEDDVVVADWAADEIVTAD